MKWWLSSRQEGEEAPAPRSPDEEDVAPSSQGHEEKQSVSCHWDEDRPYASYQREEERPYVPYQPVEREQERPYVPYQPVEKRPYASYQGAEAEPPTPALFSLVQQVRQQGRCEEVELTDAGVCTGGLGCVKRGVLFFSALAFTV